MEEIKSLILYEDEHICVCHKPAGVLSQADRSFSQDLAGALAAYEKKKGNKAPFIAPVNRLDRPVEGIILYAKSSRAAAALAKQLSGGRVCKRYYAVVQAENPDGREDGEGSLSEEDRNQQGKVLLEDYLLKDSKTNVSRVVEPDTPGAKKAELEYRILDRKDGRMLLEIELHTGRHHQIRVQLANAGMPLIGDTKYNPAFTLAHGGTWHNLALCSCHMEFFHPVTGKSMRFFVKPKSEAFEEFGYIFSSDFGHTTSADWRQEYGAGRKN